MNDRIEKLISEMTIEEKLGQLTQELTSSDNFEKLSELAEKGELGSCILTDTPWAGTVTKKDISLEILNKIQRA